MRNRDTFRGCLIGGAAGDVLGYAVEFMPKSLIYKKYGPRGITEYALTDGVARISDDTQMTLFTADGLLLGGDYPSSIRRCYLDWLKTQEMRFPLGGGPYASRLLNEPKLFSPRAPGNTCLSALHQGGDGTPEEAINQSKGCGGVMRVAPIGLYFGDRGYNAKQVARLGAQAAALTHGHPLGWMPAAMLAQIIYEISQDGESLWNAAAHALDGMNEAGPDRAACLSLTGLIEKAMALAGADKSDPDAIRTLGEGWTGDEALAIALYCALKYPSDLDSALIAAVNHGGDSDSTGAIAGNIVGAMIGYERIPSKYKEHLELHELILQMADALWQGGEAP
ncbi:MAG: ADP-ribosylglycohydrolase family protein [Clostridia bacterium]|nr:ADP-ribosylglycohydrolase family protein [Clostridia bacterium]